MNDRTIEKELNNIANTIKELHDKLSLSNRFLAIVHIFLLNLLINIKDNLLKYC